MCGVVLHHHARHSGQQLADVFNLERFFGFHVDSFAVASCDGNACGCGGDGDVVVAQDLVGLVHQFLFLGGVAVVGEVAGLRDDVVVDLVRIGGRQLRVDS